MEPQITSHQLFEGQGLRESLGAKGHSSTFALRPCGGLSTADYLHALGDPGQRFPLAPSTAMRNEVLNAAHEHVPLEVGYRYHEVSPDLFRQAPLPGMQRWQPLLPPLSMELSMGEGGTPLVSSPELTRRGNFAFGAGVWIKDESRNPTFSHKDRLNLCAVSAALHEMAPGVVVASSGNHALSAAAYARRADLPCIVLLSAGAPASFHLALAAYGATVLTAASQDRWPLLRMIHERLGYHPVSNLTQTHTGHPYASEGYKTIAYEILAQRSGRCPEQIFVPTGYGELLYGLAKGFRELKHFGLIEQAPQLISCEPAVMAPLASAWEKGLRVVQVARRDTIATSLGTTVGGLRGDQALRETNGRPLRISESELLATCTFLRSRGMWLEPSAAAGVAGYLQAIHAGLAFRGDVVCIVTSAGFKYPEAAGIQAPASAPLVVPEWAALRQVLERAPAR